jgi:D-alanine-D-alanine ligase
MPRYRVALVDNVFWPDYLDSVETPDAANEFDTPHGVRCLMDALRADGHDPVFIQADERAYSRFLECDFDIVFNLAEGVTVGRQLMRGESRESHIPCMLELLGIPYTGSGPLCLALCLDKVRTKEICLLYGIPTPRYQVFTRPDDWLHDGLRFPLIAKLSCEGSAIGLSYGNVADTPAQLYERVAYLLETYQQPVLVEEYIEGREFTVGVLGNDEPLVLPVVEIKFNPGIPRNISLQGYFSEDIKARFDPAELTAEYNHGRQVPAQIGDDLRRRLTELSVRAFRALDCRDWCRMEYRMDREGHLYILELNPIAGIEPGYHLPAAAEAAGISYNQLILMILGFALKRYGMQIAEPAVRIEQWA